MCTAQNFAQLGAQPRAIPEKPRAFYRVGRRPLDGMEKLYNKTNFMEKSHLRTEHQHFIGSDGRNFGFMKEDGVREDNASFLPQYAFDIPAYGATKYDAECIDLARAELEGKWEQTLKTATELGRRDPAFPQDMDDAWRYHLLAHNCQHYVDEVLKHAEAIARRKGVPLIVK